MKDEFGFDPVRHVYTLNGKRLYGVTTVLGVINKPALVGWAAKMVTEHIKETCPEEFHPVEGVRYTVTLVELERAKSAHTRKKDFSATIGTDIHAECETLVNEAIAQGGKIVRPFHTEPMVQKFIDWAMREDIKFLASEKQLYSKTLWVAGTCDLLFEKDGKRYVGDIKTTSGIYDRTPFFQCAGYEIMLEEGGEVPFDGGRCIIRLGKDGSFEVVYSNSPVDKGGFLAALELFKSLEVPVNEKQKHIKRAVVKKKHTHHPCQDKQ